MSYYFTSGWTHVQFHGESVKVQLFCYDEGDNWLQIIKARFWGPNGIETLNFGDDSSWFLNKSWLNKHSDPYRWNEERLDQLATIRNPIAKDIYYQQCNACWAAMNQEFVDMLNEVVAPYYKGPWF